MMNLLSSTLVGFVRLLVGAAPRWQGVAPDSQQRVYFANHCSHLDSLALWAALPRQLRKQTQAVAARDYWGGNWLKRWVARRGLNALLIDRKLGGQDALEPLLAALREGHSLILFPEGTRGNSRIPAPFKSGLFHLARQYPQAQLIPVYLENLNRAMPKGRHLPVPFICTVRFGAALQWQADEEKSAFLDRAHRAVADLA
jgi:1-acyl-sn-glycerol-3-phosphate acyltransferase